MKKIYFLLLTIYFIGLSICLTFNVNAQGVGINSSGNPPDPSALLDLSSTTKGTLITRMTTTQRDAISNPAQALMIFNTTTNCLEVYGGTVWQSMGCICNAAPATPGIIGGSTAVCINSTGNVYSISAVSGATSYNWTVPSGASITANNGISITVSFGATISGNIAVSATNNCGTSGLSSLALTQSGTFSATGGTVTTSGGYTIHTFTSSGTFVITGCGGDVEYLVVGGGGGGGGSSADASGGGGAGGFRFGSNLSVTAGNTYTIGVGNGGSGGTGSVNGSNGGDSYISGPGPFVTVTAAGGGGGAYATGGGSGPSSAGNSGGSGGGGGNNTAPSGGTGNTPSVSPSQGNNGGNTYGGGGGAGGIGADNFGAGGLGLQSTISGSAVYYAAGGSSGVNGTSTNSIGGAGTSSVYSGNNTAGVVNTGSGGGGDWTGDTGTGKAGGSGIVIIRYPTLPFTCGSTLTIAHTIGTVAPETKTVTYGTVSTTLGGTGTKCWITQNLGADQEASSATDATEASAGWYWQFNRKQGYKVGPTPSWTVTFISENSDWLAVNDPCTIELGAGWRIPTSTEWTNADANGAWASSTDTYNSVLKLHSAGYLLSNNGALEARADFGVYMSSAQANATNCWIMNFNSSSSDVVNYGGKAYGYTVRCIKD